MWALPVTQVPPAHRPRQEHEGAGWPGRWEGGWACKNQQQKGVISRWAAAAVTSRACVFSSGRFFLWASGNKRHRAGRSGCSKGLAIYILQKAHCPQPRVSLELGHSDVCAWLRAWRDNREISWKVFERTNFSVNGSDGRATLQIGFTKFRPAGWTKEEAQKGRHWPSQNFVWRHHRSLRAIGTWDHMCRSMFRFLCNGCTLLFRGRVEMRAQGPPGTGRVWIQVPGSLKHWFVDTGICIGLGIELTKIFNFRMT